MEAANLLPELCAKSMYINIHHQYGFLVADVVKSVHIQASEKLLAQLDKDGGLQRLQVLGEFLITTASDKLDRVVVKLKSKNSNDFQFRVSDTSFFRAESYML